MVLFRDGIHVDRLEAEYRGQDIVIAIDSSKSNSAMIVGDPFGNPIHDYEFGGAGSNINVYDLCRDISIELQELFSGANVLLVGIEDIITKNSRQSRGRNMAPLDIHESRAKITAVFNRFIFYFQDFHKVMPKLINNQAWKASILPEEYRKRKHDKGSLDFANDIGSVYAGRTDDVTDAFCIYKYIIKSYSTNAKMKIEQYMPSGSSYQISIVPESTSFAGTMEFEYNPDLSLSQNLETVSYLVGEKKSIGSIVVPIDSITYEMLITNIKRNYKFEKGLQYVRILLGNK